MWQTVKQTKIRTDEHLTDNATLWFHRQRNNYYWYIKRYRRKKMTKINIQNKEDTNADHVFLPGNAELLDFGWF